MEDIILTCWSEAERWKDPGMYGAAIIHAQAPYIPDQPMRTMCGIKIGALWQYSDIEGTVEDNVGCLRCQAVARKQKGLPRNEKRGMGRTRNRVPRSLRLR